MLFKMPILAIWLCGVTWAGTCQAGFLENGQDLLFLHNIINSVDTNTGATGSDNATQGNGLDSSQIDMQSNSQNMPGVFSNAALNESVTQNLVATVPEPGTLIDMPSNSQNRPGDLSIVALNESVTQNVGANLAATIPEPGTFYLVAMGLSFFGLTAYRQRRERTETPPGADQS